MTTSPPGAAATATVAPAVRRARTAVLAVFALNGANFATWAARLPETQSALHLTDGQLGLLLLVAAVGSVGALPLAGSIAVRTGTARAVMAAAVLALGGIAAAGAAAHVVGSWQLTAAALLVFGIGMGVWDVTMNLEGADVERGLGRSIMPAFHAGFSLGTVAGAGLAAAMAALGVSPAVHFALLNAAMVVGVAACVRAFLPEPVRAGAGQVAEPASAPSPAAPSALRAWTERRTLLVGVMVLAMAFTEGTANDWLSIALVEGYGVGPALGAVGFAAFLAAMTAARFAGTRALDRWGRVPVLRATMLMSVAGVVLVVFAGSYPLALVGAVVWGAGASLGFPVGMSAAADDPVGAAQRVSVVSTIGYTAFLAGPPLLGLLGDAVGSLPALLAVAVVCIPSLLVTRVAEPPAAAAARSGSSEVPGRVHDAA